MHAAQSLHSRFSEGTSWSCGPSRVHNGSQWSGTETERGIGCDGMHWNAVMDLKWATLDIICRGSKLVIVCSFQSLQTSTYIKARSVEIPVLQPFFQRTSTRFFKQSHGVVSALESVAPPSLFESQAARRFPLFCLATWLWHSAFIGQSQVVFGAQLSAILPN